MTAYLCSIQFGSFQSVLLGVDKGLRERLALGKFYWHTHHFLCAFQFSWGSYSNLVVFLCLWDHWVIGTGPQCHADLTRNSGSDI